MSFVITDRFNNQIVATRKTVNAAKAWSKKLNEGLALYNGSVRYAVAQDTSLTTSNTGNKA